MMRMMLAGGILVAGTAGRMDDAGDRVIGAV
jgi:hypothetical protein